ncbi:hypothetical protein Pmani_010147 [Petrolisthes manimaculis]|uniref:Sulfotransferase domain-containing protein n=1 Tax=Petrolisthes manimaculis TaxID=1843537 RepID=A0AAE1Q2U0_9EUCA|nr:hypothetical protein Pmani_010147 [Petrolisthes manimaculis]
MEDGRRRNTWVRWWQMAWLRLTAGRWRRVLAVLVILSVLVAAQLLSGHVIHVSSEREEVTPQLVNAGSALYTAGGGAAAGGGGGAAGGAAAGGGGGGGGGGEKKSYAISSSPLMKIEARQSQYARVKLMEHIDRLETRELQKFLRLYESFKNPASVNNVRMEHALHAVKVGLLEEISGHGYSDIFEAATQAKALSSTQRPAPLKVIIATTWRSGSTFLEELLSSHPATYNHYEPLLYHGIRQVREEDDATQALQLINDLLSCRYAGHDKYIQKAKEVKELFSRNKLVWKSCSNDDLGSALCFNENFLSSACHLYPWATMKLVRLRLRILRPVLLNDSMNVRIIFLVRDPRGVTNSRNTTVTWCHNPDCNDPSILCSDMMDDLEASRDLEKEFPGRVILLRYEDLALNPVNKTRELLTKLGLDFDSHMADFLASHTTKNLDKPWSTSRESKTRITYWATKMNENRLNQVQKSCSRVMGKLGYLTVNTTKEVTLEKVLAPLPPPLRH